MVWCGVHVYIWFRCLGLVNMFKIGWSDKIWFKVSGVGVGFCFTTALIWSDQPWSDQNKLWFRSELVCSSGTTWKFGSDQIIMWFAEALLWWIFGLIGSSVVCCKLYSDQIKPWLDHEGYKILGLHSVQEFKLNLLKLNSGAKMELGSWTVKKEVRNIDPWKIKT